jgi:von Willebrand factor type A domain
MRRNRPPTLVSMWMLDVFCCALGCVTLLWLLKTREAGQMSDDANVAAANLSEVRQKLGETEKESALRLANAEKLSADVDELNRKLALMRQERDDNAKNLALAEEAMTAAKKDLALAKTKGDDLEKTLKGLNSKLSASDVELAKKRGELEAINKQLELAKKSTADLEMLVREKDKARSDAEARLKTSQAKLDDLTASTADATKAMARLRELEGELKNTKAKLEDANVQIIDLQGTKAKLADKVNRLQIETDNKFAGISLTGKNVIFLIDMSGSMDRVDENQLEPNKWPTVRDTLCKVMRSLPDLHQFQVILFSSKAKYLIETSGWIEYEKEKSIDRVHKAMTAVKPTGDTNMYLGLEEAFRYREKGLDTIYLLSDGLPTSGPGLSATQERSISDTDRSTILSRYVRQMLKTTWNSGKPQKVRINSIGFFYESPDVGAFLWALCRENDGSFVGMSKP